MKSELETIMLKPAILALVRQILTIAGTALVAKGLAVTSRKVVWLFLEQVRLQFVPVLHRLQGRLAAQG